MLRVFRRSISLPALSTGAGKLACRGVGVIFGTGFAPFRGGPLQHIKASGAALLLADLQRLTQQYGSSFTLDPGWQELIAQEDSRP